MGMLGALFGCQNNTPEEQFWEWFAKNEARLFAFESDQKVIFDQLTTQMRTIHKDLTFEFGPIRDNDSREFIISAGGMKQAFPHVEKLWARAPELERWEFIKFRPRRTPIMDIEIRGHTVKTDEVRYALFKDGKKVGIMVFFEDFTEVEKNFFGTVGFLLLDEALGEYDVATKLGAIEFQGADSKYYDRSRPLNELPQHFDEYSGGIRQ